MTEPPERSNRAAPSAQDADATRVAGARSPVDSICGAIPIRIARDGTWFYHGSPIGRKPLVRLFASVLRRRADGAYWLVTPVERGTITVDDAPFVAVLCEAEGEGRAQRLRFTTNLDESVVAGPAHPIRVAGDPASPAPYLLVRPGLEARIARSVYYQLADLAVEEPERGADALGVWSDGVFFPLAPLG